MKNYIWDFDGTLFDTYPLILDSVMKTLDDLAVKADCQEVYRLLKEYSSKKMAEVYQLDFQDFSQRFHDYEAEDGRLLHSFPGTKETLAELKQRGGRHFIMTHRPLPSTEAMLAQEELLDYFDELVGPENHFPRKPDPSAINYLVEKYQLLPQETVMIGDRLLDVVAGEKAGVKTCFFDVEHLLKGIKADYIRHSMAEILTIGD